MAAQIIAISFPLEVQIEIERIVTDDDQAAALEFVKSLREEISIRKKAHCEPIFGKPGGGVIPAANKDVHKKNNN